MLDPKKGLNMAATMRRKGDDVTALIRQTVDENHGVVYMRFNEDGTDAEIGILDEPFEPNVRVYP